MILLYIFIMTFRYKTLDVPEGNRVEQPCYARVSYSRFCFCVFKTNGVGSPTQSVEPNIYDNKYSEYEASFHWL
jgi:hypothetical protein